MADETAQTNSKPSTETPQRGADEVALDMMKFIALTTGYGKPAGQTAGFSSGKPAKTGSEEYADALLNLFERCREVVKKT